MSDLIERLKKIADASRREDGSDIPLGAQLREAAAEPQAVVNAITSKFAFEQIDKPPSHREHGRVVYTLLVSYGDCFIDLSFTPRLDAGRAALKESA